MIRIPRAKPVMVDELVVWHNAWGPFRNGSCHLTCDDLEKLHEFAAKIGLKRAWFQDHYQNPALHHYDLTPGKRAQALAMGAVFVPMMDQARSQRRKKMRKRKR